MSGKAPNNYPVQNGWLSTNANMELTDEMVNFRNTSGLHNFTNSSAHVPQKNYPTSNVKLKPELCLPYSSTNSLEPHQNSDNMYNKAPVMSNSSFNSQSNQGSYNFAPNLTFQDNFTKQIPPSYPVTKLTPNFDIIPPQSHSLTNNFYSDCSSNKAQPNLPSPNVSNIPPVMPLHHPPPFYNFNNSFQQFCPTQMPSQQQGTMQHPQKNCGPMYNVPPPTNTTMHIANNSNEGLKFEQPLQSGQFGFGLPQSQFLMSFSSEKPLVENLQNQPICNNFNVMLPPPSFCDPPPYPFHIPPPSICTVPEEKSFINQRHLTSTVSNISIDENRLSCFLERFRLEKKVKPKSGITVAEFRSSLQKGFLLSKMLQYSRQKLMSLLQSSEDEWETEIKNVAQLKHQLSVVCGVLSVPSNLHTVQRKLKLIKKKREIKMKLKQEASNMKLKKKQEREVLSQEIDKYLDTIKEKNLKQKRELEMKKEADNILSEVRRKIQEAKKTIEKIKVFEKLRLVRQTNAEQKGLFSSAEQNVLFEQKVSELRALMQSQLSDYEAEERALKVMLETEQEGQLEQEAEWRARKGRALQLRRQRNLVNCLFGDSEEPSTEDPLFLFFQHHNSGNISIENLVQIRHHWDVHLSDVGEAVPSQWVVPVPPSNPSWEVAVGKD